jgi:hypothetical protein
LALSVWPGLPQVWSGQEILGLFLAALFALELNLALVSRWVWTESFAPGWPGMFAIVALVHWSVSLGFTLWWTMFCHPERYRAEIDRLYRTAIEAYLQGRWNDARRCFEQILTLDETDADALMQLGSLYVRTDQSAAARRAFRQCLEQEGGAKWRWEIQHALVRLGGEPPSLSR